MKIKNVVLTAMVWSGAVMCVSPVSAGILDSQALAAKADASTADVMPVSMRTPVTESKNGLQLALTPPMGWNSWNHFAGKITDADIRAQADIMAASGMREAGYTYIVIDDTWQGKRDAKGVLHPNKKFPDMKALADYVHSKGFKLGIYSSPGKKTCAGYEGSYGHEIQDAQTFADWGVDFLKYDNCGLNSVLEYAAQIGSKLVHSEKNRLVKKMEAEQIAAYSRMGEALQMTGRPIVYSISQYGLVNVEKWAASTGANMWRTTNDIKAFFWRIAQIGFKQNGLEGYAGPSHWNDPDMLEVGNGRLTPDESRTHMTLWCLLAAPLIAGNDMTKMSPETLKILADPELIAIDQDSAGKQGRRIAKAGRTQIWARQLADGSVALGLFNRGILPHKITVDFKLLGLGNALLVRDVWAKADLGVLTGSYTATVPKHGVVLLKVRKI